MYLEHFGLREQPFLITPHTEFFFAGANRGATLEALLYAITHDEGIVKVTGEVGSGKTMLCRMLLERLPENVETVYLANPSLSREEILYAIADELGTPLPEGRTHLLLRSLQERLLEIYAAGRQVVVLIDEAHAMPAETLEEVRLLSNLESNRHKLLKIVLFGQPELDERLARTDMRQLKERITHNFALEPLKRNDIAGYLMFRMRAAGYHGPDLFTERAVRVITLSSEGLTRRINILADKALLAAFSQNAHQVDQREAKAAVQDAQFKPMADGAARPWAWIAAAMAGAAVFGAAAAYLALRPSDPAKPEPAAVAAAPATSPTTQAPGDTSAPASPPAVPDAAKQATPAGVAATATGEPPPAPPAPQVAPTTQATQAAPATPAASTTTERGLGPLTSARLAASADWLRDAPSYRYFIQLISVDAAHARDVEAFLSGLAGQLDSAQLRAYRSSLSGQDRIGVIYGEYRTREAAIAAIAGLPPDIRLLQPHPRTVSKLR